MGMDISETKICLEDKKILQIQHFTIHIACHNSDFFFFAVGFTV